MKDKIITTVMPFLALMLCQCSGTSTDDLLAAKFVQPPLAIAPRSVTVQVTAQFSFSGAGGTPPYRYELSNGSGYISGSTYTAPATTGSAVVSIIDTTGSRDFAIITIILNPVISCPANYIVVPFNAAVGTTADFCVAKYEMKNVGAVATSQSALTPWVSITYTNARTACQTLGTKYHLITNPEWMTVARNVETTSTNWDTGTVNSGTLNSGHNDAAPNSTLAASTDSNGCSGTGEACSDVIWNSQRRTFKLSNGEMIWDFAGNAWEWIDWQMTVAQKAYSSVDGGVVSSFREWTAINTNISVGSVMEPKAWQATNSSLNTANGIGTYLSDPNGPVAAIRGGAYNNTTTAGIFALDLSNSASASFATGGFRCAYQ